MIRARNVDASSALRYIVFESTGALPALTGTLSAVMLGAWPFRQQGMANAKIVDVIISQATAGTAGTSWTVNVKKNGTTVLATNGVMALASGANAKVDAKAEAGAVPSGATRPVLKTDGTVLLTKGDVVSWDLTVSGTYTGAAPQVCVTVVIDPYPL